jgi:hypothetical protein
LLEARNLLDGGLANVLVNDPTGDYPWVLTYPDGSQVIIPADTQSETTIALAGNRTIVAYNDKTHWREPPYAPPPGEFHFTGYAVSKDGGKSFTDMGHLPDDPTYTDWGDPVLAYSVKTGTTYLVTLAGTHVFAGGAGWFTGRLSVYRSLDNGTTFEPAVNGTPGFTPGGDFQDKPWMAVDNYRGPGFGNVYLAWTRFFPSDGSHSQIMFTRSTDDGLSWGPDGGVPITPAALSSWDHLNTKVEGTSVTVGPDHAVYVFWYDTRGPASFLMRKSTDFGMTFGPEVTVTTLQNPTADLGIGGFRTLPFFQAAVNPANGAIYVVYHDDPSGSDRADVYFRQSLDGGATWSDAVRVNDDSTTNDQWSPALAVTPDGKHVGVFWYDRRLDPNDNLIDRYGAIGTVSGSTITFGPNFRVTDTSFPPVYGQDSGLDPTYMGDYDQAVADNRYFYATWGDNRLANPNYPPHVNQPDVRFAKIPVDWAGTALTAAVASLTDAAAPSAAGAPTTTTARGAPEGEGGVAAPGLAPVLPPGAAIDEDLDLRVALGLLAPRGAPAAAPPAGAVTAAWHDRQPALPAEVAPLDRAFATLAEPGPSAPRRSRPATAPQPDLLWDAPLWELPCSDSAAERRG